MAMNDSFSFRVWSGLLENGHHKKMGNALWEFLWLISKITKEENGIGYVLGGRPVQIDEIASELSKSWHTVQRNLKTLEKHKYIKITKVPYGILITINKSKKFQKRPAKNGITERDMPNLEQPDMPLLDIRHAKNDDGHANSAITNKDIKDIKDINKVKNIFDYWNKKEIIKHRELNKATESAINAKLKTYTIDEIKDTIHNYSEIVKDKDGIYYYHFRFTLKDFMQRHFEKFTDADTAHENYLQKKIGGIK